MPHRKLRTATASELLDGRDGRLLFTAETAWREQGPQSRLIASGLVARAEAPGPLEALRITRVIVRPDGPTGSQPQAC